MTIYKIPSKTVITIFENKRYITFKLMENLILDEINLQSIEESFMIFYNQNILYYVPCDCVTKIY